MKNLILSLGLGVAASFMIFGLTGCTGNVVGEEGEVESAASAIITENALTPNALTPNALTPNALTPNALTPNALTPNALTPNALSPIMDPGTAGTLSRQFLKYTVGCALSPTQSFSFSWTDESDVVHDETY